MTSAGPLDTAVCLLMGLDPSCRRFGLLELPYKQCIVKNASAKENLGRLCKTAAQIVQLNQRSLMLQHANELLRAMPREQQVRCVAKLAAATEIYAVKTASGEVEYRSKNPQLAKLAAHLQESSWDRFVTKVANIGETLQNAASKIDLAKLLENRILAYPALGGGLGALLGAATGPSGHVGEAAMRGLVRGGMAGLGASAAPTLADALNEGGKPQPQEREWTGADTALSIGTLGVYPAGRAIGSGLPQLADQGGGPRTWGYVGQQLDKGNTLNALMGTPENPMLDRSMLAGGLGLGGAMLGDAAARIGMGRPSWEDEDDAEMAFAGMLQQ